MHIVIGILLIICGVIGSIFTRKLKRDAAFAGGIIALLLLAAAGFTGIGMLAGFFIAASVATSIGIKKKSEAGLAEANAGKRNLGQVLANGGVAGIAAIFCLLFPSLHIWGQLFMAGSLASAAADTLSSEFGNAFGSRFINVVTFKRDVRGLDGVISLEGTLAGIVGSIMIAFIYSLGFGFNNNFVWIISGGLIGNFVDSFLGATLERKGILKNDSINFLNTFCGGLGTLGLRLIAQHMA